ncbi:MAG TPA: hypothetical protein VJQ25_05905 [Nitrospira sp.]|nr:hypothetical protein [Nitrospira sp.]
MNYYPELNRKDSPVPITHYQRPGFRPVGPSPPTPPTVAPVRCIYRASNEAGYCVIGSNVYYIDSTYQLTLLGSITPDRINPCSMIDNRDQILLVDGSDTGWTIDLADNTFAVFVDDSGLFQGADKVDYIDTFVLWKFAGVSNLFGSTLSNTLDIDPTYFAAKTNYPDNLETLIVNRHVLLLIGNVKSEIWYDAGNPQFPFAELPGTSIEHGTAAKYSVASQDISTFWLGNDLQGKGMVFRQRGYQTTVISNPAITQAIQDMQLAGTIDDAIGYTYQQGGHIFYVLTFPTGDQTWVFDDSIEDPMLAWHQRGWTDSEGIIHRDRSNCGAFLYGQFIVGDWENGQLYALDDSQYFDRVNATDYPISFIRTFPHITSIQPRTGNPQSCDGKRVQYSGFLADIECGNGPLDVNGNPAAIGLRWSDDRGKTYGNAVLQSSGAPGEWLTQPQWQGLGIARDRVFEISHQIAGPAALNGAWVFGEVLVT